MDFSRMTAPGPASAGSRWSLEHLSSAPVSPLAAFPRELIAAGGPRRWKIKLAFLDHSRTEPGYRGIINTTQLALLGADNGPAVYDGSRMMNSMLRFLARPALVNFENFGSPDLAFF
jgi:hypothetical protein